MVRNRSEPLPSKLVVWGATILVGKTREGRLVLTRRRWKYFTLIIGVVVGVIVVTVVVTAIGPGRRQPGAGGVPGLFVAQLYEPEGSAQFKASDLSDRDARVWRRIALVPAIIGIVLGCIAGAAGNIGALAFLLLIGILLLVFAVAVWTMLWIRNRQLRAKP